MTLHCNWGMRDQLSVRLPRELNAAVAERAKREARRPSDIVRLALQAYLKAPAGEAQKSAPDRVRDGAAVAQGSAPDRVRDGAAVAQGSAPDRVRDGAAVAWGALGDAESVRTLLLPHVPAALCRALTDRAARERLSVADYVLDILERRQFRERLQSRPRVTLSVPAAALIREGRDSR